MTGTMTWRAHTRLSPLARTALSLVLIAASLAWGAVDATAAHATPTLTVTPSSTVRVPPTGSTALSGLAVSGDAVDNLTVTVATDFGTLGVATTTNLTLGYNNSWTGTQAVTFSGLQSDINTGLASVTLTTTGTTGTAHVSLTAFVSQAGLYYLASNQHFYQYVASASVTWTTSDVNAKASSFQGQQGYLATIPNDTVNTFISTKIANANNIWFGARAYEAAATDGSQANAVVGGTTYARVWRWAVGANESPIQGNVISECPNAAGVCTFANAASFYSSWAGGEPNNYNVNGTVAYAGEYVAVTNWGGTLGKWNDLPPGNTGTSGYVVEYGGRPNADPTLGTGFAGVVTASADTAVANAPAVPDAPVIGGTAGNTSVALTWNPPFNGGAAISGYEVSLNGGGWTAQATSSSSAVVNGNVVITVAATVGGLTNGTSYGVRIRALNSAG
ncbi:MAG: trimeric autotransporter adhesin, partial [Frankiaceae bacterium]|nr:trimeric autotransporter adhesin [Frankiaceae bacterium]